MLSAGTPPYLVLAAIALVSAALLTGCSSSDAADTDQSQTEESSADVPQVVQGTADDVQHAFADNGEFGQEQNVAHPVLVTGKIGAVRKDFDDELYITFRVSGGLPGPIARFSKAKPLPTNRLAVGRSIKVLCPSLNLVDSSAVLEDCVLQ